MIRYKRNIYILIIFSAFTFFNVYFIISEFHRKSYRPILNKDNNIVLNNKYIIYEPPQLSNLYLIERAEKKKKKTPIPKSGNPASAPRGYTASAKDIRPASRSASSSSSISCMWPANGVLSSGYGMREGGFHKGIDIALPSGSNIYAFADGIVSFSGWDNGGYGNLVIISHANNLETYYAHNSKLLVKCSQPVKKGQLIALSGNTGDSDGPHCHFEIRKNEIPFDPLILLKR